MTSKEFLSQDEVDALLKGVTGESEESKDEAKSQGSYKPYNLATQERIVRGRMPTLEIINERFTRLLRVGLFNFMRRTATIAAGQTRVTKYSEFIRNLVLPTSLNLVQIKPLRGTALFVFNPKLVFLVIDSMFGGDGRLQSRVEGRDFSPTEQSIIQRLLHVVFEEYAKAWKSVYELKFEFIRSEANTQFTNIVTPNEVVVSSSFNIEIGESGGELYICMPYSMIEPIRELLYNSLQGEQMEADRRWLKLLTQQVQFAEVELAANLTHTQVTIQQIMSMQAGDVISITIPETVVAEVDGVPIMECKYGISNGQYALKVEKILTERNNNKFGGAGYNDV